MADNVQDILRNLEVNPPPGIFDKISVQLVAELNSFQPFENKLYNLEIAPPVESKANIFALLDQREEESSTPGRKAPVISLFSRRIAVAALIVGVISASALFLFNADFKSGTVAKTSSVPRPAPEAQRAAPGITLPADTNEADADLASNNEIPVTRSTTRNYKPPRPRRQLQVSQPQKTSEPDSYISYAELEDLSEFKHSTPIAVEAPPIRDKQGRIIMDEELITADDPQYIIVTSPNGEQTRLSKKFINTLSYMNGELRASDINRDGAEWKKRFDQWRNHFVQQAAFIPAASNFLDIFELKELMQER